jgi:hypothetical protein
MQLTVLLAPADVCTIHEDADRIVVEAAAASAAVAVYGEAKRVQAAVYICIYMPYLHGGPKYKLSHSSTLLLGRKIPVFRCSRFAVTGQKTTSFFVVQSSN